MNIRQSKENPGLWMVIESINGNDKIAYVCYSKKKAMAEMKRRQKLIEDGEQDVSH